MALAASSFFSAFDVTDGSQERDISEILTKALYYDLNLLGAINVDFGTPADDTTLYWNDDVLNSDTTTTGASAASNGTTVTVASGHGIHEGDLLYDTTIGSTETMQVTATAATAVTVTRSYNSTVAASIASAATLAIIRAEQESSDIGNDRTPNVLVRTNFTQIFSTFDLAISGSQLARKMATTALADFFAHQLANRAIEMKINLTRAALYGEKSASAGSDTVYRTLAGARNWVRDNSGTVDAGGGAALSYSVLNSKNLNPVNLGVFPDLLVIGTDLVGSVAGIDSTVRRLRESDRQVGYTVQEILLNQGNMVQVVVDARVKPGDYFLLSSERVRLVPFADRGFFVKQAPELKDGKRARVMGEWTMEFRNPNAAVYGLNRI